MNRQAFFADVRSKPFSGKLSASQVSGMEAIFDEWERRGLDDLRWLAYMLATAYHETAHTMQPIAEYGHGKGRPYGRPGHNRGQIAYGRGYVQLTWDRNYERADKELGLGGRLIANYELALDPNIAAEIMFGGMIAGWFTTKKLSDYFSGGHADAINARRIINGTDRAKTIAGYYDSFYNALLAARNAAKPVQPVPDHPAPKPPPSPIKPSPKPPAVPVGSGVVGAGLLVTLASQLGLPVWALAGIGMVGLVVVGLIVHAILNRKG